MGGKKIRWVMFTMYKLRKEPFTHTSLPIEASPVASYLSSKDHASSSYTVNVQYQKIQILNIITRGKIVQILLALLRIQRKTRVFYNLTQGDFLLHPISSVSTNSRHQDGANNAPTSWCFCGRFGPSKFRKASTSLQHFTLGLAGALCDSFDKEPSKCSSLGYISM